MRISISHPNNDFEGVRSRNNPTRCLPALVIKQSTRERYFTNRHFPHICHEELNRPGTVSALNLQPLPWGESELHTSHLKHGFEGFRSLNPTMMLSQESYDKFKLVEFSRLTGSSTLYKLNRPGTL